MICPFCKTKLNHEKFFRDSYYCNNCLVANHPRFTIDYSFKNKVEKIELFLGPYYIIVNYLENQIEFWNYTANDRVLLCSKRKIAPMMNIDLNNLNKFLNKLNMIVNLS